MHVLALNPGSSTLKFRLYDRDSGDASTVLDAGTVDHVAGESTTTAADGVIRRCLPRGIDAVGCRVVHGGERFTEPALVDDAVLAGIAEAGRLAPLHNPVSVAVLEVCRRLLPGRAIVAVFDTAFHRTIPEVAALYALPLELSERLALRRYGFHGISHRYVSERMLSLLGRPAQGTRLIVCHLGNGASVCAVRDGRSVDTSMGLTPLEGLVMGTRSGDVDPGLLLYLLNGEGMSPKELAELLNQRSGLKGLAGNSDVRDLQRAMEAGDAGARRALEVFAYRVRKYLGAYAAVLGGVDGVAFTGGIGEHSAPVRGMICAGMEYLNLRLDAGRNAQAAGVEGCISAEGSLPVWVVPTDEERQVAREAAGRG